MNRIASSRSRCSSASKFEDLRLNGDVERRRRLVRDDHGRVDGESARDGDPLALSAREFVRQARRGVRRQADPLDEESDPVADLAPTQRCP